MKRADRERPFTGDMASTRTVAATLHPLPTDHARDQGRPQPAIARSVFVALHTLRRVFWVYYHRSSPRNPVKRGISGRFLG